MAGVLLSGPAGAGKTLVAQNMVETSNTPAVVVDFQQLYAALVGDERDPETGRYPERQDRHGYLLPLVEYLRRTAITAAQQRDLFAIVTNSDGDRDRRAFLLGLLGAGGEEVVIDPGIETVTRRLSVNGQLSRQCQQAVNRWFSRINA